MEMNWLEISNIIHLPNEGSNWGSAHVTKTTSSHPEFHLPSSSTSLKLPRVSVCLSLIKISTQKSSLRWRQTGRNWGCMGLGPVNEILMSNKPSLTESYVHGRKNSKCLITPPISAFMDPSKSCLWMPGGGWVDLCTLLFRLRLEVPPTCIPRTKIKSMWSTHLDTVKFWRRST